MYSISAADLDDPRVVQFIGEHLLDLAPTAPVESQHALGLAELKDPGVKVWVAVSDDRGHDVVGSVALAPVGMGHEELKSMRTDPARRGEGIAAALLGHALADAGRRGVGRVSLETGSGDFFAPARRLYRRSGFLECAPFGDYGEDANSVFMTVEVTGSHLPRSAQSG
ncbi:GNAT family N-acetyltransferase [Corynebacterium sp. AOP40-9SA-29]|uniref:GNAT family N-acetyltransferase n=1 Tax=Corynebacterium sp. AOP40-9SA-29 TaxID=3457677 RepID=UPI004034665C